MFALNNNSSDKQLALQDCTTEQSVFSLENGTESSIFDLDENVKRKYENTEMYRSLENAELEYASLMAQTQCTRCTQDTEGEILCCQEKCKMFEAKLLAYERGISSYSPCYNCPEYLNSCAGIEVGFPCPTDNSIPLDCLEGVIDDDMYELLDELGISKVKRSMFKTIKSTIEYFDKQEYKRTDLIFCTYFLNKITDLLISSSFSPQEVKAEITLLPNDIGYKVKINDSVIYATDDIVMINGEICKHQVLRVLEEIPDYRIPSKIEIEYA